MTLEGPDKINVISLHSPSQILYVILIDEPQKDHFLRSFLVFKVIDKIIWYSRAVLRMLRKKLFCECVHRSYNNFATRILVVETSDLLARL